MPKNPTEEFAEQVCRRTFLSLWTFCNPRGKADQELCDVLAVHDPDVIVISVKAIAFKDTHRPEVDVTRWRREAVEKSVKQVFGAERRLGLVLGVTSSDGSAGLRLPDPAVRRVHRIAVVIGGEERVPLTSGGYADKGGTKYVHVVDGVGFATMMQELDTVTDLVRYLRAKEDLQAQVVMTGEEDLMALYLHQGRVFPNHDLIIAGDDLWSGLKSNPQYLRKKQEDEPSYVWDRLVEVFCHDQLNGGLLGAKTVDDAARALRVMAREDRFSRRGLGKAFSAFLDANQAGTARARVCVGMGEATYVFLGCPVDFPREDRITELRDRCLVARMQHPNRPHVVGIATETPKAGQGFSIDLADVHLPEMTPDMISLAQQIRDELGYFRTTVVRTGHEDEYPQP